MKTPNIWLNKKIFLNALKRDKIFLTKENIGKNGATGYNVYILYKNNIHPIKGISSYWSDFYKSYRPEKGNYNKPQEIIKSITFALGIKNIKQLKYRVI